MNLEQFHHGIRAARNVLQQQGGSGALVIMGSQSILASYTTGVLDADLMMSMEVDIMPIAADEVEIERLSDYLHGALGQDSLFQESHGFHVDGITIETAVLPPGWINRLVPAVDPSSGATGWCLDPHDLAVAKLIAGRPKDRDFVGILVRDLMVDPREVRHRLGQLDDVRTAHALSTIEALVTSGLEESEWTAWWKRRRQAVADRMRRTKEPSPAEVLAQLASVVKD
jgi:hypothetical protein